MPVETVTEFLERNPNPLPTRVTVERTKTSSYLFYALVRHYRKRIARPKFISYSKAEADATKSAIEEHSTLLSEGPELIVLEGFSLKFTEGLRPPDGTYILAETDGGELKAEPYSYHQKRTTLKILYNQLALDYHKDAEGKAILTLRGLTKMDWSGFRSYEEFEPFLRKAKIMGWSDAIVEAQLTERQRGNTLTEIKRGQFHNVFELANHYGAAWAYNHLIELTADLIHYKTLRAMAYDEQKCAKELGADGYRRAQELEEANQMLTGEDLEALTERLIRLEPLTIRNPDLGLGLMCLNAPIRVRR